MIDTIIAGAFLAIVLIIIGPVLLLIGQTAYWQIKQWYRRNVQKHRSDKKETRG